MTPDGYWVDSWAAMPQPTAPAELPPAPFTRRDRVFADTTVRQTIHTSVGGDRLRLRISNAFGATPLPITAAYLALPTGGRAGTRTIQPGTCHPITFDSRTSATIPAGGHLVSDPVAFRVAPRTNLTVTLYLACGQATTSITSHPGSRTTSYLSAGNHAADTDLPDAAATDHWYFLSALEAWSPPDTATAVMLGDSLTDGRGSTTNGNDRWPDQLLDRLHAHPDTTHIAIVNQAAGGNRLLDGGHSLTALSRVDPHVLAHTSVAWLLVFAGVNDIGTAAPTATAQRRLTMDLIGAYDEIVHRAHELGIRAYAATITPFGGHCAYDDLAGHREGARQAVNHWMRTSGRFDAVIDFDTATRDATDPRRLDPAYDTGDHLHLNPNGYRALAAAVPARLFIPRPPRPEVDRETSPRRSAGG